MRISLSGASWMTTYLFGTVAEFTTRSMPPLARIRTQLFALHEKSASVLSAQTKQPAGELALARRPAAKLSAPAAVFASPPGRGEAAAGNVVGPGPTAACKPLAVLS